jgi:hypothetical protein
MGKLRDEIICNFVHSTKKWLYHYLLDHFEEDDPKYSLVKTAVEDIYGFQDEILKQLNKG